MKLRITPDGTICGLWSDAVDWRAIGVVSVRRASHVEFCEDRQMWYVQSAQPNGRLRRMLQALFRHPFGEILHWAKTRQEALDWEQKHFKPGGAGWKLLNSR
jgi:hypothetical protein